MRGYDVTGVQTCALPIYGPVIVALGSQVHDRVGAVAGEDVRHPWRVADVGLLEDVEGRAGGLGHILQIGRIGQDVEVHHLVSLGDSLAHHGRPDETGAAGDQNFHADLLLRAFVRARSSDPCSYSEMRQAQDGRPCAGLWRAARLPRVEAAQIGRASCRERV